MSGQEPKWRLVSEPIFPDRDRIDLAGMPLGEPGVPMRFLWRGEAYEVAAVLDRWKGTAREGGRADGETYVRRHYLDLRTTAGQRMVIYCDRQQRRGKSRWWLYRLAEAPTP